MKILDIAGCPSRSCGVGSRRGAGVDFERGYARASGFQEPGATFSRSKWRREERPECRPGFVQPPFRPGSCTIYTYQFDSLLRIKPIIISL